MPRRDMSPEELEEYRERRRARARVLDRGHIVQSHRGSDLVLRQYSIDKAVRAKCTVCQSYRADKVEACLERKCPLWPFRGVARELTD